MRHKGTTLILIAALSIFMPPAQADETTELSLALERMDELLFEQAFNRCDLDALQRVIHPDFEFFHDENGVQDRKAFFVGFKDSICTNRNAKPIRRLVSGSLRVSPMRNEGRLYGAIQTGTHEFFIVEPGKEPRFTVAGKFIHLWLLKGGAWKLARGLSYEHSNPKKYGTRFDDPWSRPLFSSDAEIERLLPQQKIPSVGIGYIVDGELQQVRTYGEQRAGYPIKTDSVYKVASLTKMVTAMVVLKAIDAGKLDLDEPLYRDYVDPDVKDDPFLKKLTARHVLSHQSGFPNWRYLTASKKLAFEYEPGTKTQYSGEGFEYLRKVLERRYRKPFERVAKELLFKPLRMDHTHFHWGKGVSEADYAVEHDAGGAPMAFAKHAEANAAANLLTTVEDFGRLVAYVVNGAGLSPPLYQEFISKQSTSKPGIDWGLGYQVLADLDGDEFALQHTGGDDGIKAIAIMLPKSKRGLVILSNSENGMVLWRKVLEERFGTVGAEIVRRNLE